MDEHLRELYRLAALGDPDARVELDLRARRLGSAGTSFRAPKVVPDLAEDFEDPVLYETQHDLQVYAQQSPASRRFTRANGHRRNRRRVRDALRGGGRGRPSLEDLEDW
ncbi:MAG: hypothetical protein AB7N76_28250 [Planctomycetota bacterium]